MTFAIFIRIGRVYWILLYSCLVVNAWPKPILRTAPSPPKRPRSNRHRQIRPPLSLPMRPRTRKEICKCIVSIRTSLDGESVPMDIGTLTAFTGKTNAVFIFRLKAAKTNHHRWSKQSIALEAFVGDGETILISFTIVSVSTCSFRSTKGYLEIILFLYRSVQPWVETKWGLQSDFSFTPNRRMEGLAYFYLVQSMVLFGSVQKC